MVGAVVNGNIVPLDYELSDNDIVKINTNSASTPSYEWINMAYTASAKNKIRGYFNKIEKNENLKKGEELLNKELKRNKISNVDFYKDENIDKIFKELKIDNINDLYINIGSGKYTPISIIHIITEEEKTKEEIILDKISSTKTTAKASNSDINVEGIENIKVNLASCCKPIPGDRIVGYITKGNGISVHRSVCPNISESEILIDIISKTSSSEVIIQSINSINTTEDFMFDITILVPNKEKLVKFMNDLSALKNIKNVERLIK